MELFHLLKIVYEVLIFSEISPTTTIFLQLNRLMYQRNPIVTHVCLGTVMHTLCNNLNIFKSICVFYLLLQCPRLPLVDPRTLGVTVPEKSVFV